MFKINHITNNNVTIKMSLYPNLKCSNFQIQVYAVLNLFIICNVKFINSKSE